MMGMMEKKDRLQQQVRDLKDSAERCKKCHWREDAEKLQAKLEAEAAMAEQYKKELEDAKAATEMQREEPARERSLEEKKALREDIDRKADMIDSLAKRARLAEVEYREALAKKELAANRQIMETQRRCYEARTGLLHKALRRALGGDDVAESLARALAEGEDDGGAEES